MVEKQKLVLCDIDGTVANNDHRQNLLKEFNDWDKFFSLSKDDEPIQVIIEMVKQKVESNNHLIFQMAHYTLQQANVCPCEHF